MGFPPPGVFNHLRSKGGYMRVSSKGLYPPKNGTEPIFENFLAVLGFQTFF